MVKTFGSWPFLLCVLLTSPFSSAQEQSTSDSLAEQAKGILEKHCYACHGQDGSIEGGLNFVLDSRRLLSKNLVVPRKLGESLLLRRMRDGEMPPDYAETKITPAEIDTISKWIQQGAESFGGNTDERRFIDSTQILQLVADDLKKTDESDKPFIRYFSITHLYNQGLSLDELESYRNGLSKLLNSLSWDPTISVPAPIDENQTLLRIDIRHYDWTSEIWREVIDAYPYGVVVSSDLGQSIYRQTQTPVPIVRADWFVALGAQPPLYHEILDLPLRDWILEKQLKIRVEANIEQGRVVRAGFNSSGVSRHNRLIERHETEYGAYWKSYDFSGSDGRKNLFAHPLGPRDDESFQHAGGEIIFNLPNGLQAYFLTDERGRRIDKGPTDIVSDPKRPDRAVVNGLSCMSCHAKGMIFKSDQIREHISKNPAAFSPENREQILRLYPEQSELNRMLEQDQQRFQTAVGKTGAPIGDTEPVVALALQFESELDLPMAAAESGVTVPTFVESLQKSPLLARKLGVLNIAGGTVQRQVFVEAVRDVMRELDGGMVRDHSGVLRQFPGNGESIAFSPNGELLAASGSDRTISLWDPATTELKLRLPAHPDTIRRLSFSPDGKRLASSCEDSFIRVFDVETGKEIRKFRGHDGLVFDVTFTADGKSLLSGGQDSTMRLWNVETGKLDRSFSQHKSWVRSVDCDSSGEHWVSGGNDATFILWDAREQQPLWQIPAHKHVVTRVRFVPETDLVASAAYDNVVRVWNWKSRQLIQTLIGHKQPVTDLSVAPNGRWLASLCKDSTIRIWDVQSGGEVHRIEQEGVEFASVLFTPDSRRIATTDREGILRIWGLPELDRPEKGLAP